MGDYRKLEVYQLACAFSDRVAAAVAHLPARMGDKADQLRRAADSIHEAIAEGCGLGSDPQLLKYLKIARGSANECEDELHTLNRRQLLRAEDADLLEIARRICAMLSSLINRVEADNRRREQPPRFRRAARPSTSERAEGDQPMPRAEGARPSG